MNGSGAVNGFRLSYQGRQVKVQDVKFRKKIVVIAVLVAIWVIIPYAALYAFPQEKVEIDGYFLDWVKAQKYSDTPDSSNPDISLSEYAMTHDSRGTFFYIATEGQILSGAGLGSDGFFIFIDRDCNQLTGYSVRGLGADALVEVIGWNSTVQSSSTFVFNSFAERTNFGGFATFSTPAVAISGHKLELSTSIATCPDSRVAILARHTNITGDWSEVNFRERGSALRITENHDAEPIIDEIGARHILTLNMTNKGPAATIEGLTFDYLGNVTPVSIVARDDTRIVGVTNTNAMVFDTPLSIGRRVTSLDIAVEVPLGSLTGSVGLTINQTSGVTADSNVSWTVDYVQRGSKVSYIGAAPGKIAIDGAFGDWALRAPMKDLLGDAYSTRTLDNRTGDVDIDTVKVASTTSVASFYMSVNGTMLGGTSIPSEMVRFAPLPPASNISEIILPKYGSDFAFVFIDTDLNKSTGFEVGGSETALAVVGKGNSIMSSEAFGYENETWVQAGSVDAAIDAYQLEISSMYSLLGLVPGQTYSVTFVAQDWSGREDRMASALPARISAGTRAFNGIMINEVYNQAKKPHDWIELYNTGTSPVDLGGYQIWVDGVPIYTFPSIVLLPGELFVASGLNFGLNTLNYVLYDTDGGVVDQMQVPNWDNTNSWGRVGSPPYPNIEKMAPSPGKINKGQVPIPEFGDMVLPLAIVPIMLFAIRRAKRPGSKDDT